MMNGLYYFLLIVLLFRLGDLQFYLSLYQFALSSFTSLRSSPCITSAK